MLIDRHTDEHWAICFECGTQGWIDAGIDTCEACRPADPSETNLRSIDALARRPRPLRAPPKVQREETRTA